MAGVAQFNSNVGIGTTPSGWGGIGFLNLPSNTAVSFKGTQGSVVSNAYFDTQWRYYGNGLATQYFQNNGAHTWFTAPNNTSGAGAALTFTQGMTMDASGLAVGGAPVANFRITAIGGFASGLGGAYIETGEFNRYGLVINNSNALAATNLVEIRKASVALAAFTAAGNLAFGNTLGIDFSASGNNAGATSELLNDYEEGAFTPTIIGTTISGAGTYSNQIGRYTKVGNLVTVQVFLNWTAHTGTGDMRLSGLPFLTDQTAGVFSGASVGWINNLALTAGRVLTAYCLENSILISFQQTPTGGGATASVPVTTGGIIFTMTYRAA